jgi:hypothetical protein
VSAQAAAVDWLASRLEAEAEDLLGGYPPPCPAGALPLAGWWVRSMQDGRSETRIEDYRNRLWFSLQRFRRLPDHERALLVAAVTEDRVAWRGEPVALYLKHYEAVMEARQMGLSRYIAERAPADVQRMFSNLHPQQTLQHQEPEDHV